MVMRQYPSSTGADRIPLASISFFGASSDSGRQVQPPAAPTKAAETTVGVSKVEGRLILAKQMVKDIIPNAEEYQDYLSMITEIVHQLGSEEWLELEKMKLKGR